jgi:menaquinone-9 beta-reductase
VPRYDAVVVGAGPAGSATATLLARGGAKVLLCDRSAFPRDKTCGGGLTPRGVGALERLGVHLSPAHALRTSGIEMVGPDGSLTVDFPETKKWPSYGLIGRRRVIDQKILEGAERSGVEIRASVRVVGPLFEDGVCRGVRVKTDGSTDDVEAAWTVAADGATSVVARGAGLADTVASGRGFWYTALRSYFTGVEPHNGMLEFYPLRTASGRWLPAYGWVFPLPDGSANVGVDIPHSPSLAACPSLHEAFDRFIERLRRTRPGFEGAELEGAAQGALLPEAMRGFRAGAPGLIAVGDAAGLITPYSGEGIAYALESAELAADAMLSSGTPSGIVRDYERALRDNFGFQFASAFRIMKAMRSGPLAGAAAAIGFRSQRLLRAAVRVMAYLIEEEPDTTSTASRVYRAVERLWRR